MAVNFLSSHSEPIWLDQWRVYDAEKNYVQTKYGTNNFKPASVSSQGGSASTLIKEIEHARQQIQKSLKSDTGAGADSSVLVARLGKLENENKRLSGVVDDLRLVVKNLENRIIALETASGKTSHNVENNKKKIEQQVNGVDDDDDDDDFDLFGDDDDEDDEENEKVKQQRVEEYNKRKAKKPALIAKSNIILDVKPWDDETDMSVLEAEVRKITMDGLLWGSSKLVPVGYGIKKLQISCVVEDDKVSTDDLEDQIVAIEDLVQSMDIAAFNKV